MNVYLDTSPLTNQNSGRGVGTYTRELLQSLRTLITSEPLQVISSQDQGQGKVPASVDLIHYPYFDLFFSTLPKPGSIPVVVTVHDVIPLVFPEHYPAGFRGKWRFRQQKKNLQLAAAVITDSLASKNDIAEHLDISPHKIFVIPLAASPTLQPLTDYFTEKYTEDIKLPEKYVLYIGDINYNKNLPTLLLALTQLPEDIHLCVVSQTFRNTDIPEGKTLAETIAANGLKERVHVLDIPKDQPEKLAAVITESIAVVQPSLYEGFGLPVLEAMQVGTVIVSSNTSSLPEVAGNAAILVDPTISGLAAGIEQAMQLRGEEREMVITRGKQWAAEFSWEKTAQKTWEVYQHVLREREEG